MPMSGGYRKRIHLEKSEALILGVLIILVAGMHFVLGFMYGMRAGKTAGLGHAVVHKKEAQQRSPASVAAAAEKAGSAKDELQKSLDAAKQSALEEMMLKQQYRLEPKSIADAKADVFTGDESDRSPAAAANADEDALPAEPLPEEPKSAKMNRVPAAVGGLFEQTPGERRLFTPTPEQWTIQVGSYPTRDQALAKLDRLQKNKVFESYIQERKQQGTVWYSVFVGSFDKKDYSEKFANRLMRRKLIDDFQIGQVR
jgi:cell division septation protein DedD